MIGMSRVPTYQFMALNVVGALVWAGVVGTGGDLFGHAVEIAIGDVKHYEPGLFVAVAAIGLLARAAYFIKRRLNKTGSSL